VRVLRRSPPSRAHQVTALFGLVLVASALFWAVPARADFRSVQMVDNAFQPDNLVVQLGDTVVWQDNGDRPHGVRSNDGLWDSSPGCSFETPGPCMKKGDTFSVTFQRAGTFAYHCPVHGASGGASAMAGQITVDAGSSGTTVASTTTTRRTTTTAAKPTTTAAPTTTQPGTPTTTAVTLPGATTAAPTVTAAPGGSVPVVVTTGSANTTLLATPTTVPLTTGGSDRTTLVIIALVVIAAALAGAAWYYRPGRPPSV
jgi:plastocyanin